MKHLLLVGIMAVLLGCGPKYKQQNALYSETTILKVFNGEELESSTLYDYQEYNSDSNKIYQEKYFGAADDNGARGQLDRVITYFYDSSGLLQTEKYIYKRDGVEKEGEILYTYTPEGKLRTEKALGYSAEKTIYTYSDGRLKSKSIFTYDSALFSFSGQDAGKLVDSTLSIVSLFKYDDKRSISIERIFVRQEEGGKEDTTFSSFFIRKLDPGKRVVSEEFYGADIQLNRSTLFIRDEKNRIVREVVREYFGGDSMEEMDGRNSQSFRESVYEYFFDDHNQLYKQTQRFPDNRTMVFEYTYH